MSTTIELTDEQYATLEEAAAAYGKKVEVFLAELIDEARNPRPNSQQYETDDWFRHLGMSEEEIEASKKRVREEAEMPYDADA
jgi:hypothetical protein